MRPLPSLASSPLTRARYTGTLSRKGRGLLLSGRTGAVGGTISTLPGFSTSSAPFSV